MYHFNFSDWAIPYTAHMYTKACHIGRSDRSQTRPRPEAYQRSDWVDIAIIKQH